jgi:uncharacterized membrane protein YkvA (DUF1232 family)
MLNDKAACEIHSRNVPPQTAFSAIKLSNRYSVELGEAQSDQKIALNRLRQWAKSLKRQTMVLWFCYQNPRTPWLPKFISICVVAYALSPIDLIPDFIPILGYLDDAIILPLGLLLAIRLMPHAILEESQIKAQNWEKNQVKRPTSRVAAALIVMLWLTGVLCTCFAFFAK